jgi:large subunit ribosomal protein L10
MPMNKQEKTAVVENLAERLGRATIALVSESRGMTVAETTEVRRKLRAVRAELKVAKNTLIRRAVKDTRFASLEEKLGGPVGLVIGADDPVAVAKTVAGFRELGDKFKLRGGVLDGAMLTAEEVQALAILPPREVVIAQLLGLLQAPGSRLVRLLNEPGSALARLIDAIGKKNAGPAQA